MFSVNYITGTATFRQFIAVLTGTSYRQVPKKRRRMWKRVYKVAVRKQVRL